MSREPHEVLDAFGPAARAWFSTTFEAPTPPQIKGWPAIAAGDHALILAPTGSGKTLSAFFWGLDRLTQAPPPEDVNHRTRILYISPLRALAVDVEKNLRAPLQGIRLAAERLGEQFYEPDVALRTGDTSPSERRQLAKTPPALLITTPESLYLMLTSKIRETLAGVETIIIDEIHALAATKRGAHMAVSLERLERICETPPQRIGLSATQRPLEEIARFLGGHHSNPETATEDQLGRPRPVTIVDAGVRKPLDVEVIVPVEDMGRLGEVITDEPVEGALAAGPVRRSIWPSMHPRLLELIQEHQSTIVFVNSRRLSERLATRLNELADEQNRAAADDGGDGGDRGEGVYGVSVSGRTVDPATGEILVPTDPPPASAPPLPEHLGRGMAVVDTIDAEDGPAPELVKAHHGSLSREQRLIIEDELKRGVLKGLVATSSLELGIDMGAVDLVVQVESPGAVSRGLQRVGRAGHQVGAPSVGKFFPKHRADLIEAAVVVDRMREGLIESTRYPRNPLDVAAQHIVAACAMDDWDVDDLASMLRGAANFTELSDDALRATLDLLAGRYPSEEFAELRPRLNWDRVEGMVRGRPGAQRLAVTSGGTIPDRGLYGVFLPEGTRVGELDEEMVYESRPGETFLLGASTWRIEDITHERVIVTPAPGQPGKMPFWHGDGPGRPLELGRAIGEFNRKITSMDRDQALAVLETENGLDRLAARNLWEFLDEQREATGRAPDDRTIVVERFRDEIGDWRVCMLSPFGAQIHAPWGMALQHRLAEEWGWDAELMWSDDGIVLRLPDALDDFDADLFAIDPDTLDDLLVTKLPNTAMFAARFRECAARALLLPRRRPDRRTPLWQQRQKAADLLAVASKFPSFPILLETTRECVNDVFDLPALRQVLTDLRSRKIKVHSVTTDSASPMASSLLFGWIAQYMYEGDAPLAERRATALSLDRGLLRDLLGAEELRELLDPEVTEAVEAELQRTAENWQAKSDDHVEDLLRWVGPLTVGELRARTVAELSVETVLETLRSQRRIIDVVIGDEERVAAAEDAARLRDALGVALPIGLPRAFTEPVEDPLGDLITRYARTHGPFLASEVAERYGIESERAEASLEDLERAGRVVRGEFRPHGTTREWCHDAVLRDLRRRSLAALRKEVEPVDQVVLARFGTHWQHVTSTGHSRPRGIEGLAEVITTLQGAALPASILESDILASRVDNYTPADLDTLLTAGEVVWAGAGSLGASDGRVRLVWRDQAPLLLEAPEEIEETELHLALRARLVERGAVFWQDLVEAAQQAGLNYGEDAVLAAMWDLVWAGEVTNDSITPLRALSRGASPARAQSSARRRAGRGRPNLRALNRLGPPAATGRWSLTDELRRPVPSPSEVAATRALQLLERYGVLTREMALAEGATGGFAGVYPVLKVLEERGQVRRGYFVEGLGAAQFALPGAVDRLRDERHQPNQSVDEAGPEVVVLSAADPAQPYGAALRWPETSGRLSRSVGAYVVLVDGQLAAFVERGGKSLATFAPIDEFEHGGSGSPALASGLETDVEAGLSPAGTLAQAPTTGGPTTGPTEDKWIAGAAQGVASLVTRGTLKRLELAKINGAPAADSPEIVRQLEAVGFLPGYRGPTLKTR